MSNNVVLWVSGELSCGFLRVIIVFLGEYLSIGKVLTSIVPFGPESVSFVLFSANGSAYVSFCLGVFYTPFLGTDNIVTRFSVIFQCFYCNLFLDIIIAFLLQSIEFFSILFLCLSDTGLLRFSTMTSSYYFSKVDISC